MQDLSKFRWRAFEGRRMKVLRTYTINLYTIIVLVIIRPTTKRSFMQYIFSVSRTIFKVVWQNWSVNVEFYGLPTHTHSLMVYSHKILLDPSMMCTNPYCLLCSNLLSNIYLCVDPVLVIIQQLLLFARTFFKAAWQKWLKCMDRGRFLCRGYKTSIFVVSLVESSKLSQT